MQEEYIKDEQKNLKKEFLHAQEEVKRIQSIPLVIGQFLEAVDQNTAIVGSTTGTDSELLRMVRIPTAAPALQLYKSSHAVTGGRSLKTMQLLCNLVRANLKHSFFCSQVLAPLSL